MISSQKICNLVSLSAIFIVGLVFLSSAIAKAYSINSFETSLIAQGLVEKRALASILALLIIEAEFFIGFLLILRLWLKKAIWLTSSLLLFFSFYLVYLHLNGASDCGCFGDVIKMSIPQAILKNIILLVCCMVPLILKVSIPCPKRNPLKVLFIVISMIIFSYTFLIWRPAEESVKYQDAAFLRKFAFLSENRPFNISSGEFLVSFLSTDCEHCQETGRQLKIFTAQNPSIQVVIVFLGESMEVQSFFHLIDASFPYAIANVEDFFKYVDESPPQIYLINNGKIKNIIKGRACEKNIFQITASVTEN